jgi:hypothetical protein
MRNLLAAIFAGLFALSVTAPVAAQDKKDEGKKEMKKDGPLLPEGPDEGKQKHISAPKYEDNETKKDEMKKDGRKKYEMKKGEMKK